MRVLLFGGTGQVGWELQRTLRPLGEVQALDFPQVDFLDLPALRAAVRDARPGLIVNAAGYTAVDKAESEPEKVHAINAAAPGALAEEARHLGIGLVHYSTDYVFDGGKGEPYTEDDPPHPLNVYGRTKLDGDLAIQASGAWHLILRTSWVYGARGANFFLTMLRLARERRELRVVDDQVGSPTWSHAIAAVTAQILLQAYDEQHDRILWDEKIPSGVYNYSSAGATSWYGFAREILRTDPAASEHIVERLEPVTSEEFKTAAARPSYSVLSKAKIETVFGIEPEPWQQQLGECWRDYLVRTKGAGLNPA